LLARIGTGGATIALDAMAALAEAAHKHGNGIIDITARGSIQVRGLRAASAGAFAEAIAAFGIFADGGVPILADPLAGLDPDAAVDAGELAAALRKRLAAASFAATLGPKVSLVIDAGTALHLDAIAADVRLQAVGTGEFYVALGGDAATATPLGCVPAPRATEAVVRLLEVIARHGPQARGRELMREREAMPEFRSALVDLLRDASTSAPAPRPRSEVIGIHSLRGARLALGIGVAFGHTDANALTALTAAAERAGASGLRAAPDRALLIIGLAREAAAPLAVHAEQLGFITRRDDPRRHVVACAGAPICAAAEMPARALAPALSAAAAQLLDGSLALHVSGCSKGCAHPTAAALTVVGGRNGAAVIANGTAHDQPIAEIAADTLPASLARLAGEVARAKRPHERAAETLARLGASRIAAILSEAGHE
jgi:precorrin-3B synthase